MPEELNRKMRNLESSAVEVHHTLKVLFKMCADPHGMSVRELFVQLCAVRGELQDTYHDLLMELESMLIHTQKEYLAKVEPEED